MKKALFIIVAAMLMAASCTKENDSRIPESPSNNSDLVTYKLKVSFDESTKASINESNGAFSWSGAGEDQIAIFDSAHNKFVTFTSTDASGNFSAVAEAGSEFEGNVAYYPASIAVYDGGVATYSFPTSFSSEAEAAKSFPLTGTVSSGAITLSHLGALIKMSFSNVPSFTTKLVLNDGAKDITVNVTPSAGAIIAVVPIPAGTYILTAKLVDDNSNEFFTKARASKTYAAASYYRINDIKLNHYFEIVNSVDDNHKLALQTRLWGTSDYTSYVENWAKYSLFVRADGTTKYVLLPESDSNFAEGKPIRVQLYSGDTEKSWTEYVFNYRNVSFDVSENTLKTDYRVYAYCEHNTYTNPYIYVYKTVDATSTPITAGWPGNAITKKMSLSADAYYQFDRTLYGATNITVIFNDNGSNQMSNWMPTINRDYEYKYW